MKKPLALQKNSFTLNFDKEVQQHIIKCYYIYYYIRLINICQHFPRKKNVKTYVFIQIREYLFFTWSFVLIF